MWGWILLAVLAFPSRAGIDLLHRQEGWGGNEPIPSASGLPRNDWVPQQPEWGCGGAWLGGTNVLGWVGVRRGLGGQWDPSKWLFLWSLQDFQPR